MNVMDAKVMTPAEVAQVLRVSRTTVYEMFDAGKLAGFRVGKNLRIWESSVRAIMTGGKKKAVV